LKSQVCSFDEVSWTGEAAADSAVVSALERGDVVYCPRLAFTVEPHERVLFTPAILGSAKNASYDAGRGRLGGTALTGGDADVLRGLMRRFSDAAHGLVAGACSRYRSAIVRARASFRPAEIAGRTTSWRKDDTRLHVDAFPATPSGGRRILRVFTNVNPDHRPRVWKIGEDFESVAARFGDRLRVPPPGAGALLALLRITRTPRSRYDALMLQLHDLMKGDAAFQADSPQTAVEFPAGTTWMAFTDQVSHAATSGQYQLEQTFLLPIAAMNEPERSPLKILERVKGRKLA
jgi:hypothetical protein